LIFDKLHPLGSDLLERDKQKVLRLGKELHNLFIDHVKLFRAKQIQEAKLSNGDIFEAEVFRGQESIDLGFL